MSFKIVRNDITKMDVDAIVNAANKELLPGGGVCGAIFMAAGYDKLAAECRKIGHCDTGKAVITRGFGLPAKYIIHTPGPVYKDGQHNEADLLYSCYISSLELAKNNSVESIAFPLISSGIYGYPKADALRVATNAIMDFLENNDMEIYLVVYDKRSFEISSKLFSDVAEYIEERLVKPDRRGMYGTESAALIDIAEANEHYMAPAPAFSDNDRTRYADLDPLMAECMQAPECTAEPNLEVKQLKRPMSPKLDDLENMMKNRDASFSEQLLALIDASGMTDAQVYKKANIDRKLFSKIRNNMQYKPSKVTAVAFALALKLDLSGTEDLIRRAGYALTRSSKFDIIIEYFILHKNYDLFEINEVLFAFDQPLIGA